MILWIAGMSGSGKTTLAESFIKEIIKKISNVVLLDGDVIRQLYGHDLGYTEIDRVVQIKRMQSLAKFLDRQNILVVVAALYANDALLQDNRNMFDEYFEVYLNASLELLKSREFKGLYSAALAGKIKDVVGVDIPWSAPKKSDLIFDMNSGITTEKMTKILVKALSDYNLNFAKKLRDNNEKI